jgi:hypothetical protein
MSTGRKSRIVLVRNPGKWYTRGAIVKLIQTSSPNIYELREDPNGGHEVDSCKRSTIAQDDLLQVELRIL